MTNSAYTYVYAYGSGRVRVDAHAYTRAYAYASTRTTPAVAAHMHGRARAALHHDEIMIKWQRGSCTGMHARDHVITFDSIECIARAVRNCMHACATLTTNRHTCMRMHMCDVDD